MFRKLATATVLATTALAGLAPAIAHANTANPAPEPASEAGGCRFGHWPAEAQGRDPVLQPGAAAGVYLWHAENGWHLFVTHPGHDKVEFKGSIVSRSRIHDTARDTERNDSVVRKGSHRVSFRFENYGYLDGVHFRMTCSRGFSVNATIDGRRVTPDMVYIGKDGDHPLQVPFTINRQR